MPAPIRPPQSVVYNGSINPIPVALAGEPREGRKTIPLSIFWATDGGGNLSIRVNVRHQQGAIVSISRIKTLYVDNLRCQAQVTILFTDTQFVIDVPAFSEGYYPVVTNALEFTIWAQQAADTDQTNINVLNYEVAPQVTSQFAFSDVTKYQQNTGFFFNTLAIPSSGNATLILSNALTEGVITAFDIAIFDATISGASQIQVALHDTALTTAYWAAPLQGGGAWIQYIKLAQLSNLSIPFTNGLLGTVSAASGSFATGLVNFNVYWRVPQ